LKGTEVSALIMKALLRPSGGTVRCFKNRALEIDRASRLRGRSARLGEQVSAGEEVQEEGVPGGGAKKKKAAVPFERTRKEECVTNISARKDLREEEEGHVRRSGRLKRRKSYHHRAGEAGRPAPGRGAASHLGKRIPKKLFVQGLFWSWKIGEGGTKGPRSP